MPYPDLQIRADLARALADSRLTASGLSLLRGKIGLGGQRGLALYHWAVANNIVGT